MTGPPGMSSALRSNFTPPEAVVLEEDDRGPRRIYPLPVARKFVSRVSQPLRALDLLRHANALLALGFGLAGEIEAVVQAVGRPGELAFALPTGPTVGVAIALRRSRPLLAMLLLVVSAAGGTLIQVLLLHARAGSGDVVVPILALLVLSYSLGAHGSRRELALGAIQPPLLIVVLHVLQPGGYSLAGALPFFVVFVVGGPALAGRLVRARQLLVGQLQEQERQIDAERLAQSEAALRLERLQLAGRLHQTLVTGMESLVDQVAVAQRSPGRKQAEAVAGIEARARWLLAETRKVVVSLSSAGPNEAPAQIHPPVASHSTSARTSEAQKSEALPWTALAAAAVCIGLLLEIRVAPNVRVPMPVVLLGCLMIAAPLALAWSRTLLMTAALHAAAALFSVFVIPLAATFTAISLSFLPPFMVAFYETRRRSFLGLAVCCLGELACFGPLSLPANLAFLVGAWSAGRVLQDRSQMVRALELNNALLAEQREVSSRQLVLEERARVARELHDAIGHNLTVVALQAGAARRMWTSDHEKAVAVLTTIAGVAAEGLAELRMGFASGQPADARTSTRITGLGDVEALLKGAEGAGLAVRLHMEGDEPILSADTELAAYRVLQEALTNLLRHAPGATADVTIRTGDSNVQLVVSNSAGDQPSHFAAGQPHGLKGMRERVEACGGRLDWGRRADGGFEVRAEFPAGLVKA